MHVYNHPQVDIIAEDHTVQCLHLFFLHAFTAFPPSRPSAEAAGVTWIPTFFGIFVGTYASSAMSQGKKWKCWPYLRFGGTTLQRNQPWPLEGSPSLSDSQGAASVLGLGWLGATWPRRRQLFDLFWVGNVARSRK